MKKRIRRLFASVDLAQFLYVLRRDVKKLVRTGFAGEKGVLPRQEVRLPGCPRLRYDVEFHGMPEAPQHGEDTYGEEEYSDSFCGGGRNANWFHNTQKTISVWLLLPVAGIFLSPPRRQALFEGLGSGSLFAGVIARPQGLQSVEKILWAVIPDEIGYLFTMTPGNPLGGGGYKHPVALKGESPLAETDGAVF